MILSTCLHDVNFNAVYYIFDVAALHNEWNLRRHIGNRLVLDHEIVGETLQEEFHPLLIEDDRLTFEYVPFPVNLNMGSLETDDVISKSQISFFMHGNFEQLSKTVQAEILEWLKARLFYNGRHFVMTLFHSTLCYSKGE